MRRRPDVYFLIDTRMKELNVDAHHPRLASTFSHGASLRNSHRRSAPLPETDLNCPQSFEIVRLQLGAGTDNRKPSSLGRRNRDSGEALPASEAQRNGG